MAGPGVDREVKNPYASPGLRDSLTISDVGFGANESPPVLSQSLEIYSSQPENDPSSYETKSLDSANLISSRHELLNVRTDYLLIGKHTSSLSFVKETFLLFTPFTAGDYNGDGIIDAADYTVWRDTLGQSVAKGSGADGNVDGLIDAGDYDFWKMHFGEIRGGAGASASTSVPEPSSMALTCLAATGLAVSSFQRQRHCKT